MKTNKTLEGQNTLTNIHQITADIELKVKKLEELTIEDTALNKAIQIARQNSEAISNMHELSNSIVHHFKEDYEVNAEETLMSCTELRREVEQGTKDVNRQLQCFIEIYNKLLPLETRFDLGYSHLFKEKLASFAIFDENDKAIYNGAVFSTQNYLDLNLEKLLFDFFSFFQPWALDLCTEFRSSLSTAREECDHILSSFEH